ncbi:hypothetical protein [Hymenobacter profundi]|uniref:Uncharacterized protein n=1 Tax=Hymenobacter profundi TaxID=1982110 RepID=A0ABS6X2I2_9BACT|nr:hypothetical protein [Hymenobacter profundi]MBW3129940.1 hypothetical protein [Hymenobacter profundi]
MSKNIFRDWSEASENFDEIKKYVQKRDLTLINEAQTRFDIIDRIVKYFLSWQYGDIEVESYSRGEKANYVDYILKNGDYTIIIEAKRAGASFPNPGFKSKLKLNGSILGEGEIADAIKQAEKYALEKEADIVVVTNGLCWCFYSTLNKNSETYASILFPFDKYGHAEQLFDIFSIHKVSNKSLDSLHNNPISPENRLINISTNRNMRVDRNSIAEYITPALDNALYADALLSNKESLDECFVSTESRTKYDNVLRMYLADPKPNIFDQNNSAKRIRKEKPDGDHIGNILRNPKASYAPPVTLLIGSVGSGKSTFLKHFELISGKNLLSTTKSHWIYIDFEKMGQTGNPRNFIYGELLQYLHSNTDYKGTIEPAYSEEIAALARGPYSAIFLNKEKFNETVFTKIIEKDLDNIEPYVDKVFKHLVKHNLCAVVLDNVDLYEDEKLETSVLAEGLALSKRININIFVSIRETTFVKHSSTSTFNAYELRKLWIDAPPFREVLSKRLSYSKKILEKEQGKIPLENGITINISDLSSFFDLVQKSILDGDAGHYIESISDLNIRKGIGLVTIFLTSGHINADIALQNYLVGDKTYHFPFHEVFKGSMLGYWRHFREDTTECINLFDSKLNSKKLRLLRFYILGYLTERASSASTLEVILSDIFNTFHGCGATNTQIIFIITSLEKKGLIRSLSASNITEDSSISATKSGGYYIKVLCKRLVYIEECMFDTAIEDADVWQQIFELTNDINRKTNTYSKMTLRKERMSIFINYIKSLEAHLTSGLNEKLENMLTIEDIEQSVLGEINGALERIRRRDRNK